jgi:CheY-like chemotaxis protein
MEKIFHESMIANIFLRPLNTPVLIDSLNMIAEVNERMADRKSILIVDDDATFLHMVKEWLAEEYRVTIVTSGMQAITYLANNRPDLILLDYEMPVTSGPQVLGMIRAESGSSNLPVMFLTGKGDRDSVSKVLSLKPDGYLLKSSGKKEVLKSIKKFFDERKAREMTEM